MNLLLNIFIIIVSLIGAIALWYSFLIEGGIDWFLGIIWFLCTVVPGIVNDLFEDLLKQKYEIPNRKMEVIYKGKTFKKNTFTSHNQLKGYVVSQIIWFTGTLPLIWWVISSLSVVFFEWIKSFF